MTCVQSRNRFKKFVPMLSPASMSPASKRLAEERKAWKKDHPYGFTAIPETGPDGQTNLLKWKAIVPGKQGTPWEGGHYILSMEFTEEYPSKLPLVFFVPPLFHPNVYPSGWACFSILIDSDDRSSITIKQVRELSFTLNSVDLSLTFIIFYFGARLHHCADKMLIGIQDQLNAPNMSSLVHAEACDLLM